MYYRVTLYYASKEKRVSYLLQSEDRVTAIQKVLSDFAYDIDRNEISSVFSHPVTDEAARSLKKIQIQNRLKRTKGEEQY